MKKVVLNRQTSLSSSTTKYSQILESMETLSETSKILSKIVQLEPEISVAILSRDYQDSHTSIKTTRQVLHTCSHDSKFENDVIQLNQSKSFGNLVNKKSSELTYKGKTYRCVTNDEDRTHLLADYHNYVFLEYCRLYVVVIFTKNEERCLSAAQAAYHLARFLEKF